MTLNLSLFVRACKSVQVYLVPCDSTASTFGESQVGVRSWFSKAPHVFLRSTSLLERE